VGAIGATAGKCQGPRIVGGLKIVVFDPIYHP
jgi:hypothetical protein